MAIPFAAFLDLAPETAAVARELLGCPERGGSGRSSLNNDGTPLQLCFSLAGARRGLRLIADPAWTVEDAEERFARGRAALAWLIEARGPALGEVCERMLARTLPEDHASLRHGAMWLAAGIGEPGLALYTTANWGPEEGRWERAMEWLEEVLPDARAARRVTEPLRPLARLVAHAVEGDAPSRARAKLYFRPHAPVPLVRMGLDLLVDSRVAERLVRFVGSAPIHAGTLVYSVGFSLADGELSDEKVDICAHCVPRPAAEWSDLLADFGMSEALRAGAAEVAFVGLGVRRDGGMRTNLYLKPNAG